MIERNNSITLLCLLLFLVACDKDSPPFPDEITENETLLNTLQRNYNQLPEKEITFSADSNTYAQYAMPTQKYNHAILGDDIEAEQLVLAVDDKFYDLQLEYNYVFEDIRPRLYDVDGDGNLELITIRTNLKLGAGIAIYKLENKRLTEYAFVPEIGIAYRWLNIVTINDLDNDGIVELVWIETPHIGGILKVAKIKKGELEVISETKYYSNHAIGERNLCLSVLTEQGSKKVFYVPKQSRKQIVGFTFDMNTLEIFEEIEKTIDFTTNLGLQYDFKSNITEKMNCINANEKLE